MLSVVGSFMREVPVRAATCFSMARQGIGQQCDWKQPYQFRPWRSPPGVTVASLRRPCPAGSTIHSFRFEAAFDCPADQLLAVAREFDLMAAWNRLSLDPTILAEPSIFTSVVYAGQWLPFPMHPSDLVIHAHWADLAQVRHRAFLHILAS